MPSIDLNKYDKRTSEYLQTISTEAVGVTASDSTTFNKCRAFYVGTGGDVKVQTASSFAPSASGSAVLLKNVPQGSLIPLSIMRLYATDTTASDVVLFY